MRALRIFLSFVLMVALMAVPGSQMASGGTLGWCQALAAGNPVIDVLGDSLSAGDTIDLSLRWHTLIRESFQSDGAPGTQVWTGGAIPGSATADYLPGAKYSGHIEFTANHPNLITLGWGTNDWAGGVTPPETFRAQYQAIIDRIKVLSPDSTIVILHMPWVYNSSIVASRGDQAVYRNVERELAWDNDAEYLGLEWFYPGDDRYAQAWPDRVHLNANGQGYLYTALRSFILGLC